MRITRPEFQEIQSIVRSLCGLVLSDEKTYLVESRLDPVFRARGYATFSEYLSKLRRLESTDLREELVESLTTGETSFNRDVHPFEELRRSILPTLADTFRKRRASHYPVPQIRFWSAGCSTGQEPFSIAMAIRDFLDGNAFGDLVADDFSILATDVSVRLLQLAGEGLYEERDLRRGVTSEQRLRYFQRDGKLWRIREDLRKLVTFRQLNLVKPAANFGMFDVIFCRNVLIYFDEPTRQQLCDQFHDCLLDRGFLILGAAESLFGLNTGFRQEMCGRTVVYRKGPV